MTLLDKGKQIPKKNTAHLPIMKQKSTYYKTEMNRNELFYLLKSRHDGEAYRITTSAKQASPHEIDAIALITVRNYKSQAFSEPKTTRPRADLPKPTSPPRSGKLENHCTRRTLTRSLR